MPAGRARLRGARTAGFTLVEFLVVMTVLAIVSVTALPSFDDYRARLRLRSAADNLYVDLQFARAEAVQRNASGADRISVTFSTGADWCYGIHDPTRPGADPTCDCGDDPGSCNVKEVSSEDFPGVQMTSASFGGSSAYEIDPRRGQLVDASGATVEGSVLLTGTASRQMRADVNAMGRVRLCSPDGVIPGYPSC